MAEVPTGVEAFGVNAIVLPEDETERFGPANLQTRSRPRYLT
ncbi:MAG: hypothetical protein AABM43_10120 [Actinomycetota bacterium]